MSAPENAYETLGLSDGGPSTSESDIKKAYRKLALKKHPDKNPDNPEAAEEFAEIQKAYEILCDKEARSALDEWLRIQSFKKQKLSERDEKRRKMAEDLERREKMVDLKSKENTAKMKLQEQLERLRKDAADRQQNIYSRLVRDKEGDKQISERMNRTVKLNWNENEGLSFESLRDIVSDHGKIEDMVLRDAKIGKSALVVMKSADSVGSLVSSDTLSRLKIKVLPLGESLNLNNRKSEVNLHGTNERVEPKLSKNKRVFPATQSASHEMKTRATKVTELEAQVLGRLRSVAKQAGK